MYDFLVIRLCQNQTVRLEAITNLVSPLVHDGIEVKRELGTNHIFINEQKHSIPTSGKGTVEHASIQ